MKLDSTSGPEDQRERSPVANEITAITPFTLNVMAGRAFRYVVSATMLLWVPVALAAPAQSPSEPVPIHRNVRVVVDLVNGNGDVISYDNFSADASAHMGQFPGAIFNDAPADHRFILFDDVTSIKTLSTDLREVLTNGFAGGGWILGIKGSDSDLKSALGLLPAALEGARAPSNSNKVVFLYRNPVGILCELMIDAPTDKDFRPGSDGSNSLTTAMDFVRDWHRRKKALVSSKRTQANEQNTLESNSTTLATNGTTQLGDGEDPWNALQNFEWDGTTVGTFSGSSETAGTYKLTLSPYWLDSDQNGKDWYRVDIQTYSEITNYEYTGHSFGDTSGKCGWFTNNVHADAAILTPGGQWWDFMPDTTVGGTSEGFTIGGDISTSSAGISGSYSKTYGTPDVTIQVLANAVDQSIDWTASLTGCGSFSSYPYYSGASSAAHTTYNLDPSFIIAVPSGQPMELVTATPAHTWGFEAGKYEVKCLDLCLDIKDYYYYQTETMKANIKCTKTSCIMY